MKELSTVEVSSPCSGNTANKPACALLWELVPVRQPGEVVHSHVYRLDSSVELASLYTFEHFISLLANLEQFSEFSFDGIELSTA